MDKFQNKYRIPSARHPFWNYGQQAAYFITICTHNRENFFGEINDGRMRLNDLGNIVAQEWMKTVSIRPDMNLHLDEFVVMPNHFHAIIIIGDNRYNANNGDMGGDIIGRDAMHRVSTVSITTADNNTQDVNDGNMNGQDRIAKTTTFTVSITTADNNNSPDVNDGNMNRQEKTTTFTVPIITGDNLPLNAKTDGHDGIGQNTVSENDALDKNGGDGGGGGDDGGGGRDAMPGVSTGTINKIPTGNKFGPQSKNLASIVRGFKSSVTTHARKMGNQEFAWQPRFHDHIIRNAESFDRIQSYIRNNPLNWRDDKFFSR